MVAGGLRGGTVCRAHCRGSACACLCGSVFPQLSRVLSRPVLSCPVLQVTKDKDAAVRGQDFEKAGQLRDREMELKAKISAIIAGEGVVCGWVGVGVVAALGWLRHPCPSAEIIVLVCSAMPEHHSVVGTHRHACLQVPRRPARQRQSLWRVEAHRWVGQGPGGQA